MQLCIKRQCGQGQVNKIIFLCKITSVCKSLLQLELLLLNVKFFHAGLKQLQSTRHRRDPASVTVLDRMMLTLSV